MNICLGTEKSEVHDKIHNNTLEYKLQTMMQAK